jgi:hypothetical protein
MLTFVTVITTEFLKVNTYPVLEFGTVHNWAVTDVLEEQLPPFSRSK